LILGEWNKIFEGLFGQEKTHLETAQSFAFLKGFQLEGFRGNQFFLKLMA
jgi:hypothetical protein